MLERLTFEPAAVVADVTRTVSTECRLMVPAAAHGRDDVAPELTPVTVDTLLLSLLEFYRGEIRMF